MSTAAPSLRPASPPSVEDSFASFSSRLAAADRTLQKERGGQALLRGVPWVLGMVLAAFAADVALHFGAGIRLGITTGFSICLLVGGAWAAWIAFRRRNPPEHTARILETRHPRLGSKLINLLQLRAQAVDGMLSPLTRQLAAQAVASYAEALRHEPIEQLARTDVLRREARRTGWAVLAAAALLGLFFDVTRTEIPRFLDPLGDHPPYSFTRLEISEPAGDGAQVVYGQSLLVIAKASGHRPDDLYLSYFPAGHREQSVTAPMFDKRERGFTQQIEGIRSDLILFAHTKNKHALSRQRRIAVILTPRLERAWVKVTPPAYTGLPPDEQPFHFKNLKALEGSAIEFRLQSNRPLGSGQLTVEEAAAGIDTLTMTPTAEYEVSAGITGKQPARLKFSITDRDGFSSEETWESTLTVTHDLPPDVQITNPNSDAFVAMDFIVEPVIEASDDYGLKTLRIHTARNEVFGEPRVITYEQRQLHAREPLRFEIQKMGLAPGDTISIFAEAIDNAPDPHLARSKTVTLTVISTEDYNDFLRERTDMADVEAKYAKLMNEFRDLVEQQKKLGEQIEALKKELAEAKTAEQKAAVQKKLDELLARQNALNAKLNQLAETMEHFVREQPLYDIEAELKNTLAGKAQEVRESTKVNDEAMKKLAAGETPEGQQPPPGSESKGGQHAPDQKMLAGFKQASDEQLARLGATEEAAEKEVLQPLEDLSLLHEIVKDINRYKDLYAEQEELAKQAKAYDRPGPLGREDQLALRDLAARQREIGNDLDAVEQKLWEDGKAAQEKFPKAGGSAQEIARAMGDLRLQTLANRATAEMLAANGPNGAQLAETLRREMEKLFSHCNAKDGMMNSELDQYMSIQRSMHPGKNFRQMMKSRKFGSGFMPGMGHSGNGGQDGQAMMTGANANVLGGESRLSNDETAKSNGAGKNKATPDGANASPALDKSDVIQGVNPMNRESEAVQGETSIDQYSDIVEKYFKALTREPKPAPK